MADLIEAGSIAQGGMTGKTWDVKVIQEGQGSSAYYPASVLEEGAPLFKPQTKIYLNHPTADAKHNQPERDARDIIGYFTEGARYNPTDRALYQKAHIFESHRDWVRERAEAGVIGMSIRAEGALTESNGRKTVERFTRVHSVDLVTEAGAGGKFVSLLESAPSSSEQQVSESTEKEESEMDPKLAEALDKLVEAAQKNADAIKQLNTRFEEADKKAEEDRLALEEAERKKNEKQAPTAAEIADALVKAGLTESARARVLKAVEDGAGLAESIKTEQDIAKEILAEAAKRGDGGAHVEDEDKQLTEAEELKAIALRAFTA